MKLIVELVPQTSWYTNVRSNVSKKEWDIIRNICYTKAKYKCEICNGVGKKHPVECHEIWEYDDVNHIQKLIGIIALCPTCHKVKHAGLARINGEEELVIKQLMDINSIGKTNAIVHLNDAFKQWQNRSRHKWTVNIDYIQEYLKNI